MPRARRLVALALSVALALGGCKTVHIWSVPKGAEVLVDGEPIGKTPCKLKAYTFIWLDYDVEVRKPGFKPWKEKVEVELGDTAKSFALGCLLGIITIPLVILCPLLGDVDPLLIQVELEPDFSQLPPPQTGIAPAKQTR